MENPISSCLLVESVYVAHGEVKNCVIFWLCSSEQWRDELDLLKHKVKLGVRGFKSVPKVYLLYFRANKPPSEMDERAWSRSER